METANEHSGDALLFLTFSRVVSARTTETERLQNAILAVEDTPPAEIYTAGEIPTETPSGGCFNILGAEQNQGAFMDASKTALGKLNTNLHHSLVCPW